MCHQCRTGQAAPCWEYPAMLRVNGGCQDNTNGNRPSLRRFYVEVGAFTLNSTGV